MREKLGRENIKTARRYSMIDGFADNLFARTGRVAAGARRHAEQPSVYAHRRVGCIEDGVRLKMHVHMVPISALSEKGIFTVTRRQLQAGGQRLNVRR
jgi:hypothetical protein